MCASTHGRFLLFFSFSFSDPGKGCPDRRSQRLHGHGECTVKGFAQQLTFIQKYCKCKSSESMFNFQVVAWRLHRPARLGVAAKTFQSPLKREVLIRLLVRFPVSPPLTLGRVAASYVTVLCRSRD